MSSRALFSWYVLVPRTDQLICMNLHILWSADTSTHALLSADVKQHAFWSALCPRQLPVQLVCALIISWSIHADYLIRWSLQACFWSADQSSCNPCSLCSAYHLVNSWSPSVLIHAFWSADYPLNISNQLSTYTLCSAGWHFLTASRSADSHLYSFQSAYSLTLTSW